MSVDRFIWENKDVRRPLCWDCRHLRRGGKCKAFPNGIPAEFLSGEKKHNVPYPDDNDVQFEPVKDRP